MARSLNQTPSKSWTLDELASYARRIGHRNGEDTWRLGKALSIARDKQKSQRTWLAWLKTVDITKSTAYRLMDVPRYIPSLKHIKGRSSAALFEEVEYRKGSGGYAASQSVKGGRRGRPRKLDVSAHDEIGPDETFPWAVREPDHSEASIEVLHAITALEQSLEAWGRLTPEDQTKVLTRLARLEDRVDTLRGRAEVG